MSRRGRRAPLPAGSARNRSSRCPPAAARGRGPGARSTSRSTTAPASIRSGSSRVPDCTSAGLHGEGVVVAVFDSGFPNLSHEAFAPDDHPGRARLRRTGVDSVRDSADAHHGTNTSPRSAASRQGSSSARPTPPASSWPSPRTCAARRRSKRTTGRRRRSGPRPSAPTSSARRSATSTSTCPFTSYTRADMNGETAVTTRAAAGRRTRRRRGQLGRQPAASTRSHNTLGAPADGRARRRGGRGRPAGDPAPASARSGPTADGRIKPDVAAMGVQVKVARHLEHLYGVASGTSFSCPLTAGVVALILQAHPTYTVDDVAHRAARRGHPGGRARHAARLGHRRRRGRGGHAAAESVAIVRRAPRGLAASPVSWISVTAVGLAASASP